MKKHSLIVRILTLIACVCLTGCTAEHGGETHVTDNGSGNETTPGSTATPVPTAVPTVVPDPSSVTLVIEDFNEAEDIKKVLTSVDLSSFGITQPEFSFTEDNALEGKALQARLEKSAWCQAYEFRGKKLNAFRDTSGAQYFRMWVSTPDDTSVSITVALGSGAKRSFFDAGKAVLTSYSGRQEMLSTGNASDDAGEDSSLRIPAGFSGYLAYPLDSLKAWRGCENVSDISKTDYLKFDIRPSVAASGDRYVIDRICLSDSPVELTDPASDQGTDLPAFEKLALLVKEALSKEATYQYCPEYDPVGYPGIKAIWLDGAEIAGVPTKVFAFIGFPDGASDSSPVPGVVLMHGGGGYAFPEWVKIWNDRGYAAIAVGNTGYYPAKSGIKNFYNSSSWTRDIPADVLAADARKMPPDNDGMYSSTGSVDRMWMYHAVVQTVLANTLLRSDPRVDADKIGITGISWGGVITSVAIGFDNRFAFAIPVYGSGYLNEALSWMGSNFNSAGTAELWEPSLRFGNVRSSVLWLCWTDDNCFSINSNSKSYEAVPGSVFSPVMNMLHGHFEGWGRPEIYRFADSVVKGGQGLCVPLSQPDLSGKVSFRISRPSDASSVTARVCYITEPLSYSPNGRLGIQGQDTIDQEWHYVTCKVNGDTVSATLPSEANGYYVEITAVADGTEYITATRFIQR
ncbi:MAG: hypothetical protein J5950_08805 [Clostridia bacterium]|nr:hypothetical protein [Clostridia bacterium]